ncbi:Ribonuclease E [Poriferisphaera corsica]|uniref:Ribonuclease G n=2 Tax=Poriferisphaera corsica TaxID=2528020 RepID=A0A517YVC4_9BACT|nr:Ribonuclease E [Poriferisphaera corsica]
MLINNVPGEECRIAIAVDGKLDEFYQERSSAESHVGNIYKGRVTNVEASIQAAFIDFGLERNGFLHISDLHPKYFPGKDKEEFEQVGSKTPRRDRPPIQKCLKRGQEITVQVLKEGIGTKGPTLTSYLSIPGRFIVMMPDMQRLGVSRKVEDEDARRSMKKILNDLKPPSGFGFIVRTAGIGQTKTDLKRDLAYLARLWKSIEKRKKAIKTVGELYAESDLVIRTIRDVFRNDISRILIDDVTAAKRARDFLAVSNPRTKTKVVYYNDLVPIYHRFGIEDQIDQINAREVPLPSGGALVFDQAEALVAIDVNSGKSRDAQDAESNAFNTNMEAVDEICRQLKLRDLGGLVVNDLIDMRESRHRRKIESRFRQNLKNDRARSRINPISQFGMLEMTRQRMRPSLKKSIYNECVHCAGTGHVKTAETVVLEVMRKLAMVMHHRKVAHLELVISPDVAFHLLNRKRAQLVSLERKHGKPVMVRVGGEQIDFLEIKAYDERKTPLNIENLMSGKQIPKPIDAAYIDLAIDEIPMVQEPEEALEGNEVEAEISQLVEENAAREAAAEEEEQKKRRRRRRGSRGGKKLHDESEDGEMAKEEQQEEQKDSRRRRGTDSRRRRSSDSSRQREGSDEGGNESGEKHERSSSRERSSDRRRSSDRDRERPSGRERSSSRERTSDRERSSERGRSSDRSRRRGGKDEKREDVKVEPRKAEDVAEQYKAAKSDEKKSSTRKKTVRKKRATTSKKKSVRTSSVDKPRKVSPEQVGNVLEEAREVKAEVNGNVADHLAEEKKPIRKKRYTTRRVSSDDVAGHQAAPKPRTKVRKKRASTSRAETGNQTSNADAGNEKKVEGRTGSKVVRRKKRSSKSVKKVETKSVTSSGYSNRMLKK